MIIDLPPHIEQAIIAKAHEQGLTVQEMLAKDYDSEHMAEQHGIYTTHDHTTSPTTFERLQDWLDEPPTPSKRLDELTATFGGLGV